MIATEVFEPVEHESVANVVVQSLETMIVDGVLKEGARLPSERDLSDRLGVSRQSVNAIEKGRYDPSLPLAFTIADVFELAIEEIFSRD